MKKIFYSLLAGAMALVSCNKDAMDELRLQNETTTFTLSLSELQTRAESMPARYIMEVYNEDGTTAENVFDNNTTNRAVLASNGKVSVVLDKEKAYTCLFWGDDNVAYNVTNLKAVTINTGKVASEAFYAKVVVPKGKNPTISVSMKRAIAKVILNETGTVEISKNMTLKLSNQYPAFDVLAEEASGTANEQIHTMTPLAITGEIGSLYVFAKKEKQLFEFKFAYGDKTEKTVSNVPYQQNYITKIKGVFSGIKPFSFVVTADDVWGGPNNDENLDSKSYKVGDYYPEPTNASTAVGVVFWVDPTNPTRGKIVSPDEGNGKTWTEAQSWLSSKTLPSGMTWKSPTREDMQYLYCAYIGVAAQTWQTNCPCTEVAGAKTAFNGKLNALGGTPLSNNSYWTLAASDNDNAWGIGFSNGNMSISAKNNINGVRVVSAFGNPPVYAAHVGDFYYSDRTYSSTYNDSKTCIGIVFWVNPDNASQGKFVGLDERAGLKWSTEELTSVGVASSVTDGLNNTNKVLALAEYNADKFPIFAWCATKKASDVADFDWYIPAKDELSALGAVKAKVNASLDIVGKLKFTENVYWSSTENNEYSAWKVTFLAGNAFYDHKNIDGRVRVISLF